MLVLAVANQKGGVGKSTTAYWLGREWASWGMHTLLVDLDPQHSLSKALLPDADWQTLPHVGKVLEARVRGNAIPSLKDVVVPVGERLHLAPGHLELVATEVSLMASIGRDRVLKLVLEESEDWDVAIVDCMPAVSALLANALAAAQAVVIPVVPEYMAVLGLRLMVQSVVSVRRIGTNPGLEIAGVVVNQYQARARHHRDQLEEIRRLADEAGTAVLGCVPRRVRLAERMGKGPNAVQRSATEMYRTIATALAARLDNLGLWPRLQGDLQRGLPVLAAHSGQGRLDGLILQAEQD